MLKISTDIFSASVKICRDGYCSAILLPAFNFAQCVMLLLKPFQKIDAEIVTVHRQKSESAENIGFPGWLPI